MSELEKNEMFDFFKRSKEHEIIHPEELLILFKKYAPHAVTQKEARLIFKELTTYLTGDEEHKLFVSWERLHVENMPEDFYGLIHDLLQKYSSNNNKKRGI